MYAIDISNLALGLLLIVVGLLCYRNPNLINPYGNMSPERKALVDIESLKKVVAITFGVTGFLLIVTATLSMTKVIGEMTSVYVMIALVTAMMVPLFIAMWKYNGFGRDKENRLSYNAKQREKKKNKITIWAVVIITFLSLSLVLILFLSGNKGPKYDISSECIKVKGGGYHATIPVADITEANVLEHWPDIALRTNGLSTNKVNMGHFRLKNGENCTMFIHKDGGPLLELRTADGGLYYLNCATEEETLAMIEQVKSVIRSRQTTGYNDTHTLCPHGGGTVIPRKRNAISQARRRSPNAWEIAGQARNEGYGVNLVVSRHCEERSNPDHEPVSWIASSCLLAMTQSVSNKTIIL